MSRAMHDVQHNRMPGLLLGMILFITSEVMFFGALFGAYGTVRAAAPTWPGAGFELELGIPSVITVLLVVSSLTVHAATSAARRGDAAAFARWLGATIALALAFLGGQAFEYTRLHFSIADGPFGTLFYALTGFHGLHVLVGVGLLSAVALRASGSTDPRARLGQIEAAGFYWHFVDVIWVVLFAVVYLIR